MKTASKASTTPPKKPSTSTAPAPEAPKGSTASSLPRSILNALPTGALIARLVQEIEACLPELERELAEAEKSGPAHLARAFVVLHRLGERMLSEEKSFKPFRALLQDYKENKVPQALEIAGMDNVPLSEGFRVGVSYNTRASIRGGMKEFAFTWLRENDKGDVVQPTVNASTLSALARQMGEENRELPEDIFNVALVPNTSVTKT